MEKGCTLSIESFAQEHPAMNPCLLVEPARVALARYHASPASFSISRDEMDCPATVEFDPPDPRSRQTLEREDFVEKGAIVMAGVVLSRFEKKQLTRVTKRGTHVDYFVGEKQQDFRWILEVSGTDEGEIGSLLARKRKQLEASPYRLPPHSKNGIVSVTRFAPDAVTRCNSVPLQ
jgi:hypothetical protein